MPNFLPFGIEMANIDINIKSLPQKDMDINPSIFNHDFLEELGEKNSSFSRRSFLKWERIMHSHG